jgi:hypothetical protein
MWVGGRGWEGCQKLFPSEQLELSFTGLRKGGGRGGSRNRKEEFGLGNVLSEIPNKASNMEMSNIQIWIYKSEIEGTKRV